MMDSSSTVLGRRLKTRIEAELDVRSKAVLAGTPADHAAYREGVGYLRALRNVIEWMDVAENLDETNQRGR